MAEIVYPLEQVLGIKKRRVEEAEKVVTEKQKALQKEQDILKQKEEERDKVIKHQNDKLTQMRKAMDEGTTSDEIIQMKVYLKVVKERVAVEEKKVKEQEQQVKNAEKNLADAKEELRKRRQDVDKFEAHRTDWIKETRKELGIIEGREQDELGSIMFTTRHTKKK